MNQTTVSSSEPITLLGVGKGYSLLHKPTSGVFLVQRRGSTVLRGQIRKNRFGLDTLPFERLDVADGESKTAHGHLEGNRLVVPACNMSIQVNPSLPALARLTNSIRRIPGVLQRSYDELKARALNSRIICKTNYQLTTALVLLDDSTGAFTLAWVNRLDEDFPRWHFAPGEIAQGAKNRFVRFLELHESGNASLRASSYPKGSEMMIEFEFQQPIACTLLGAPSPHIEALRQRS